MCGRKQKADSVLQKMQVFLLQNIQKMQLFLKNKEKNWLICYDYKRIDKRRVVKKLQRKGEEGRMAEKSHSKKEKR